MKREGRLSAMSSCGQKSICRYAAYAGAFVSVLLSAGLLAGTARASGADEPANARELLVPIIEALETVEYPRSGRGSARVDVQDSNGHHTHRAEFRFKDEPLSRTDWFAAGEGEGTRQFAWSMGREVYVGCNPQTALVQRKPTSQFNHRFGYDFHPATFLGINGISFAECLRRCTRNATSMSVGLNSNGLLKIEVEYQDIQGKEDDDVLRKILLLDPAKGYRPVFYQSTWSYLAPDKLSWGEQYRVAWQQYGGSWYVMAADYEALKVGSYVKGEEPQIIWPSTQSVRFRVTDFVPDAEVQDSEFTLEGLNLPDGTLVYDSVAGISYRYGAPPVTAADLEAALHKAHFPKRIQGGVKASEPAVSDQEHTLPRANDPNVSAVPPASDNSGPPVWQYGALMVLLTGVGVTALALGSKRLWHRKG